MRKGTKKYLILLVAMLFLLLPMTVSATGENGDVITTGTLGDNDGFEWTYNETTKTLTITGEDSGLVGVYNEEVYEDVSPFYDICADVEKIILKDCKPIGSMSSAFAYLRAVTAYEFDSVNTKDVSDMSRLFYNNKALIELDLSDLDTSNVTNMSFMFRNCSKLASLNLTGLDTSKVTTMRSMFFYCQELKDLDVSGFDTMAVEDMSIMFAYTNMKSLDVSGFITSNVTNMNAMFKDAKVESLDLSNFDTSNVTNMTSMFENCVKLSELNLNNFDTANVTAMDSMFAGCSCLKHLDLSSFDTSLVITVFGMFRSCSALTSVDMTGWDLGNVVTATRMFVDCNELKYFFAPQTIAEEITIELPVTFRNSMGTETTELTSAFCNELWMSEPTPDEYYVEHYLMNSDGESYELTETETFDFDGANFDVVTGELNSYDGYVTPETKTLVMSPGCDPTIKYYYTRNKYTLNVIAPDYVEPAASCVAGEYIHGATIVVDATINYTPAGAYLVDGWLYNGVKQDVPGSLVMPMEDATIEFLTSVKEYTIQFDANGGSGTVAATEAIEYFEEYTLPAEGFTYNGCELVGWSTTAKEPTLDAEAEYELGATVSELTTEDNVTLYAVWKVLAVYSGTFGNNDGFTWIHDRTANTLTVTGEDSGFEGVWDEEVEMPFSPLCYIAYDVEKVVLKDCKVLGSMDYAFCELENVTTIEFDNFDTSEVTSMYGMFGMCLSLEEMDVSGFDTSNVTNMSGMFVACESLTSLDLSSFDTSKVTDMSGMFEWCFALESLDVSNFDTSNVTNMCWMFEYCYMLKKLDLSHFVTSKVTDMSYMFSECCSLEDLDVSSFDTGNAVNMESMFAYNEKLKEIDLSGWKILSESDVTDLFDECNNLMIIRTPQAIAEGISITLPTTFYDSERVETTVLTSAYCNDVLATELPPTEYYVEHYLMNLDGETYELEEKVTVPFDGWFCEEVTGALKSYEGFAAPAMQTLVMKPGEEPAIKYYYTRNKYALNVNVPNYIDATGTTANGEYYYGATISVNAAINYTPAEAYILEGWSCNGVEKSLPGSFTMPAENVTIEFVTSVKEYTICFDANGGSGEMADSGLIKYFDEFTLPTSGFAYENYVLAGWSLIAQEPGETVVRDYSLGEAVKELTTEDSITLYAVWSTYPPVEITATHTEMLIGNIMQLGITVGGEPLDTTAMNDYVWSVDSDTVVSVSEDGTVTALGLGTATVTCTKRDNSYMKDTYAITIRIPFRDIKLTDWQYPYVVYAYENNLMGGKGENFDMNGKLTRAEFVTILYSYTGKPEVTFEQSFSDVAEGKWFADAVIWAKQNNVTAGNPNGTFGVTADITREQLVVMLYQFAKNNGVSDGEPVGDISSFDDSSKVSTWAREAMSWAVHNNILGGKTINGATCLDPQGKTTRGECATMMMRYVELAKE